MPFTLRMRDETRRKWRVFRQNRRGFSSLLILATLLVLSLFADLYANSRPLLVSYQGRSISRCGGLIRRPRLAGTLPRKPITMILSSATS